MPDGSATTLVPLFLLVVTTLAHAAREVDIVSISSEAHADVHLLHGGPLRDQTRPLFRFPFALADATVGRRMVGGAVRDPKFGRFSHIHAVNSFLLAAALVLIVITERGSTAVVLALVVGVFWMYLPVLEVEEYDAMLRTFDTTNRLHSHSWHTLLTLALTLPVVMLSFIETAVVPTWAWAVAIPVYVYAAVVVAAVFQAQLLVEIEQLVAKRQLSHAVGPAR